MPSKSKSKTQVARDKKALQKLYSAGLIKKPDLRKKPTKSQLATIKKYDAVVKGKATVVQPKDAKSFKGIFEVKGKNVIVPKRKGEKITVNAEGQITAKRKDKLGRTRTQVYKKTLPGEVIPRGKKGMWYAIPFKNGSGVFWKHFPSYGDLKSFMAGYDYKGWKNYVVEETGDNLKTSAELFAILDARGMTVKGKRPSGPGKGRKPYARRVRPRSMDEDEI